LAISLHSYKRRCKLSEYTARTTNTSHTAIYHSGPPHYLSGPRGRLARQQARDAAGQSTIGICTYPTTRYTPLLNNAYTHIALQPPTTHLYYHITCAATLRTCIHTRLPHLFQLHACTVPPRLARWHFLTYALPRRDARALPAAPYCAARLARTSTARCCLLPPRSRASGRTAAVDGDPCRLCFAVWTGCAYNPQRGVRGHTGTGTAFRGAHGRKAFACLFCTATMPVWTFIGAARWRLDYRCNSFSVLSPARTTYDSRPAAYYAR